MDFLLTNDDGVDASGLAALREALSDLGAALVVAPHRERSAQSHALTLHKPLRAWEVDERRYACSGTPADCVYLGLYKFLDVTPKVVVSGINLGANIGNDVFYSGTVAGAREAALHDVPAVAVSLHHNPSDPVLHWDTAASIAKRVVLQTMNTPPPPGVLLNINVPNRPPSELMGLRAVRLGQRYYEKQVETRHDPRGRPYYWIGGAPLGFDEDEDTDGRAVEAGWATVTPMTVELTDLSLLEPLRAWTDA